MTKRVASLAGVAVVGMLAACTGSIALGTAPSANTSDGGPDGSGGGATGPYGITCTFYHRPSPSAEFEEKTFTTRSDATAAQTVTFAGATIDVALAADPDVATDARLEVGVREKTTNHVYRLSKATPPVAQFSGGHGFTGLVYVGDDVQYICTADNAPPPPVQPYVVPLDVVCQVEVRTTPGGAVEQSRLFEFVPNVDGSTPMQTQDLATDGVIVDVTVADTAFESTRMVKTSVRYTASTATGPSPITAVAQLFQLNRFAGVVNQLANTTFTGRISVNTSFFQNNTNKEVSYACAARQGGGPTPFDGSDAGTLPDGASLNPIGSLKPCGFENGSSSTCNRCDSMEFCFTQVSCTNGPETQPCSVGSGATADNRCHKACTDDGDCGPNGECVSTAPFFACFGSDGPGALSRRICCTKGTNCQ